MDGGAVLRRALREESGQRDCRVSRTHNGADRRCCTMTARRTHRSHDGTDRPTCGSPEAADGDWVGLKIQASLRCGAHGETRRLIQFDETGRTIDAFMAELTLT